MGCKTPLPAGYQLKIAQFLTGQLVPRATPEEARRHMKRAINALMGKDSRYYDTDDPEVKNPVHGLGDGAIPELAAAVGRQIGGRSIPGAKDAHSIAQIAEQIALQAAEADDIRDVRRPSTAVSLLLEAALQVIDF